MALNVAEFGAAGDGVADDAPAIAAAVAQAEATGGGAVYFPAGVYLLGSRPGNRNASIYITGSNVRLVGDGPGVSVLRKGDGVEGICISYAGTDERPIFGGGITGLTIDGNYAGNTNGHGVRIASTYRWTIRDFHIHGARMYGIGAQAGTLQYISILDGLIQNVGGDGIDIKNRNNDNAMLRISGVAVEGHGRDPAFNAQAGIDLRGRGCIVSDCVVRDFGSGSGLVGIRLRPGGDFNGYGAFEAQVSNCRTEAMSKAGTVGFHVQHTRCQVNNSHAFGSGHGFCIEQAEAQIIGCHARNCGVGFAAVDVGLETNGARSIFAGNIARGGSGPGEDGFVFGADSCIAVGNIARTKHTGFRGSAMADCNLSSGNMKPDEA